MKEWFYEPMKGKRILVVEGMKSIAIATEFTLIKAGYDAIMARNGEEAVNIIKKNSSIDCVIMDIDFGSGMDGLEAAVIISRISDIPIIFLTGNAVSDFAIYLPDNRFRFASVQKNSSENVLLDVLKEKLL